ncbi:MAG TPA: LysM peptidoglycan-binding domain-containing protein [Aggregatilineaceae bacterium]|nr:LysM peptidoglycan-binding domain-containing protein [Aggregatilineaceae bacterium]
MVARRMGRVLVLLAAGVTFLPTAARAGPRDQPSRATALVEAVNQYRADHGLPALEVHPALMAAAQAHVEWMARTHTYSHTGEGGSTPTSRAAAAGYPVGVVYENVEGGTELTPQEAVGWWTQDSVHLGTMLLKQGVHIGAGYAENDQQQLYVLEVAWPSPAAAAQAPSRDGESQSDAEQPATEAQTVPVAVPVVRSTPGADGSIVHEVQPGQTAWAIAAVYGVDLADLVQLNHLGPRAVVHPGDRIIVRLGEGQTPPPAPTAPVTHTVQEGETLWTVAALYGLTLDDLLALNGLERGAILHPGDQLRVRAPDPTGTPTESPTVTDTTAPPTPTATQAPSLTFTATARATVTPIPSSTATATSAPPTNTFAPTWTPSSGITVVTPSAAPPLTSSGDGRTGDAVLFGAIVAIVGLGAIMVAGGLALFLKGERS